MIKQLKVVARTIVAVLSANFESALQSEATQCRVLWSCHAATCNIEGVRSDLLTFLPGDMQGAGQLFLVDASDGGRLGRQYLLPA